VLRDSSQVNHGMSHHYLRLTCEEGSYSTKWWSVHTESLEPGVVTLRHVDSFGSLGYNSFISSDQASRVATYSQCLASTLERPAWRPQAPQALKTPGCPLVGGRSTPPW
jgi:hypothetical protein